MKIIIVFLVLILAISIVAMLWTPKKPDELKKLEEEKGKKK